jgi:transcriptional regulator with XRE-family HTH domain
MHVMNESRGHVPADIPTPEQVAGRQLRLLRQGRGWSQQDVAEKMQAYGYQWSQATVTRLESASRPIRLNELFDLAILYDVPITQFLEPEVADSERDDHDALEREIERLAMQRDGLSNRLEQADATMASLARERAEAAALKARIDGRLDVLTRLQTRSSAPAEGGDGR